MTVSVRARQCKNVSSQGSKRIIGDTYLELVGNGHTRMDESVNRGCNRKITSADSDCLLKGDSEEERGEKEEMQEKTSRF